MAGYTFLKSGEKKLDDKYYQTFKGKDVQEENQKAIRVSELPKLYEVIMLTFRAKDTTPTKGFRSKPQHDSLVKFRKFPHPYGFLGLDYMEKIIPLSQDRTFCRYPALRFNLLLKSNSDYMGSSSYPGQPGYFLQAESLQGLP